MYRIVYDAQGNPFIIRSDGCFIPADPANIDFRAFLIWNAAQQTPLDYVTMGAKAAPDPVQTAAANAAAFLKANFNSLTPAEKQIVLVLRGIYAALN